MKLILTLKIHLSYIYFIIILFTLSGIADAQTTILIYHEDFENGAPGISLNSPGAGGNYGNNKWVINNKYEGTPLYPNTPDENQTESGTIAFAPKSNYLHIYDEKASQNAGISNCNYNSADSSDRFVQLTVGTIGFCTVGMKNVKLAFFYLGGGSSSAHAELYYSADQGPWIQTGTIYNNQPKWKYEIIQNPAFDNKENLRFGFRWVNDTNSLPVKMSFGVDDIFIKGEFDNFDVNFNISIDSVKPNPICQNFDISIYYHITTPICGTGFCIVELSDSTGSFSKPTRLGIYQIDNQVKGGKLTTKIPATTPPGKCYKIRINYYFTFYGLDFFTTATICIEVKHCLNTITTLKAKVITSPDSLCVGSVIDIPFFSTGVYQKDNKYIAQLSDENGNFPEKPNVLGSSPDSKSYDPDQGSMPGSVSGMVVETPHDLKDGCNYYIRIVSSNPKTIGAVYGPFCIKHCDIETNKKTDVHACVRSCKFEPKGFNATFYVKIHSWDSTSVYDRSKNKFQLEVRESMFFSVVSLGGMGKVSASNDTTFNIHIPCADSLAYYGVAPGMYYMRIVASNPAHKWDENGTFIHLLIGAPADELQVLQYPSDTVLCIGDAIYFYPIPFNAGPPMNSTYQWYLNGKLFSSDPAIGILFDGAGTFTLTVQETNNGCKGPVTPNTSKLYVYGPPNVAITGPNQICLGDTLHYQVPFQKSVYYEWTSPGGKIIDTSNNELNVRYDTSGVFVINVLGLNRCGQAIGKKNLLVTKHPDAKFSVSSPVCNGKNTVIMATGKDTPPLTYSWNFTGGAAVPGGNSPGPQKVTWKNPGKYNVSLKVTKYGCSTTYTNPVTVLQSPVSSFTFKNQCIGTPSIFTDLSKGNPDSWIWNFGDSSPLSTFKNPSHLYADTGSYKVQMIAISSNGCRDTLEKNVPIYPVPTSDFITQKEICLGEYTVIEYKGNASADADYRWDFPGGTVISGAGGGPYKVTWSAVGKYNISLEVMKNGCKSDTTDSVGVKPCFVIVPDIITPNGDEENDVFFIKGVENFPTSNLVIYNRWGKKVYENEDYRNNWDGEKHPDGVYFYILTLNTGKMINGTVTIVR